MIRRPDDAGEASPESVIPDSMPLSASDTDWRDFRARLVASTSGRTDSSGSDIWVHSVPRAEAGCILIAHPLMFTATQQYFAQACSHADPLPYHGWHAQLGNTFVQETRRL